MRTGVEEAQPSSPHSASPAQPDKNEYLQAEERATEEKPAAIQECSLEESITKEDLPAWQPAEQVRAPKQQTPSRTWASIVRSAPPDHAIALQQAPSPKDSDTKAADDNNGLSTQSFKDVERAKWIGRFRGRRGSILSTSTIRGRSGSESTIRAGKPAGMTTSASFTAEADLPEGQDDRIADLDLSSPSAFPLLSSTSAAKSPSVTTQTLSPLTASWAQIARSTSSERRSASDPTAVSDAVTSTLPNMAPATGAKTIRAKKPAPIQTDGPRKRLPVEWTQGSASSPEKDSTIPSGRKSVGSHGKLLKTAHDSLASPPKPPTKAIPFELATARRAAAREQKEKAAVKIVPAVPKALTKGKTSEESHSKTPSSDTSTTQYYTAAPSPFPSNSSQSFDTASEELHQTLSVPGSPSRIPRLIAGGNHSSSMRASGSARSPVRTEVQVHVMVSEPASRSRSVSPVEEVDEQDNSLETVKPQEESERITGTDQGKIERTDISHAQAEMEKSGDAIGRASAILKDIQKVAQPGSHVHFEDAPQEIRDVSGLGIMYDLAERQDEGTAEERGSSTIRWKHFADQHPLPETSNNQTDADGHKTHECTTTSISHSSGQHTEVGSLRSSGEVGAGASQREDTRSPAIANTWKETAGISVSHGIDLESSPDDAGDRRKLATSEEATDRSDTMSLVGTAVAGSESSFTEGHSSTFTPEQSPQWSLYATKHAPGSHASTIQNCGLMHSGNVARSDHATDSNIGPQRLLSYGRDEDMPHIFQGNATTPSSRLNARAREFVPTTIVTTPSGQGYDRPQMPPEWMQSDMGAFNPDAERGSYQQALNYPATFGGWGGTFPTGKKYKKKKRKSPKKASDSNDQWDRGFAGPHCSHHHYTSETWHPPAIDRLTTTSGSRVAAESLSAIGRPPAESGWRRMSEDEYIVDEERMMLPDLRAAAASSSSVHGPSTGSELSSIVESSPPPGVPSGMLLYGSMSTFTGPHNRYLTTSQGSRPEGSLREITNIPYGTPRQPYLGRGGTGQLMDPIPNGDDPIERWWHGGGWRSTNGGPLTMGAWYDYLRQLGGEERARERNPTIFNPREANRDDSGLREPNEHGERFLKTCGDIQMEGAFEALPHYPLMCPKCEPDWQPDMARMEE